MKLRERERVVWENMTETLSMAGTPPQTRVSIPPNRNILTDSPIRPRAFKLEDIQGGVPLLADVDTVRETLYGANIGQEDKVELYRSVIRRGNLYLNGKLLPEDKDGVLAKYLKPLQDNREKEPKMLVMQIGGDGDTLNFSEKPMSVSIDGIGTVQWNLGDGVAPDGTYISRKMKLRMEGGHPQGDVLTVTDIHDKSRSIEVVPRQQKSSDKNLDVDIQRSAGAADTLAQIGMYILDGLAVEHATTSDSPRRQMIEKQIKNITQSVRERAERYAITVKPV